jgi:hypothetical protein
VTETSTAAEPLLPERLARAITLGGAIPLSQFMGAAPGSPTCGLARIARRSTMSSWDRAAARSPQMPSA